MNLCGQLEAATKQYGVQMLISEQLVDACSPKFQKLMRKIDRVMVCRFFYGISRDIANDSRKSWAELFLPLYRKTCRNIEESWGVSRRQS